MAEKTGIEWCDVRPARFGPKPSPPRDGDKVQARQRVNVEVRSGRRGHPNTFACVDCGHVWQPGERRHEYDHHLGYAAEHHCDVEPVCTKCQRQRSIRRGEWAPPNWTGKRRPGQNVNRPRGEGGRFVRG